MPDYIPDSDAEFEQWRTAFDEYLKNNLAALGVSASQSAALDTVQTAWQNALSAVSTAKSAYDAAITLKNTTREQLENALRALINQIQNNPATTDEQRAGLGVPIHDDTRTPAPIPNTSPIGRVDTSERLRHTIHFFDSQTPTSKAKPPGVRGCEIWVYIGTTPPTNIKQYDYVALDGRTPYVLEFDLEDAGKNAYYILRWTNTRNQTGPWSETIVATITG